METWGLFSTSERVAVVRFIVNNPTQTFRVRNLSKTLKLSPAHISRILKQLKTLKIIKNDAVDLQNPLVKTIKQLFNIEKLTEIELAENAKKLIPDLRGIGIYGSWATGTNYEDSDLDIWIKTGKVADEINVAKLNSLLIKTIDKEITILTLWPEKIKNLKEKDEVFYYSLVFGSITMFGEGIE